MSSPADLDALASGAHHLLAAKYFQLAAFVMLIYDHILTLPEEVDRIWSRRISGATILFLINRYVTPLQFIIILDAFHDPRWTTHACNKFVVFEGASTVALVAVCQMIMILRVYALYNRSNIVMAFLMSLWTAQIIVSAIGLSAGFRVPLPPMLTGCILTGSGTLFPSIWIAPLITDTCIFGLTLWRTRRYIRESKSTAPTIHILLRDGTFYFLAIFMANLINTIFFLRLPADLKAIGASFSQLLTAVMISRLVLNLRVGSSSAEDQSTYESEVDDIRRAKGLTPYHSRVSFMTRTIGNLGADIRQPALPRTLRRPPPSEDLESHDIPMEDMPSPKTSDEPVAQAV